MPSDNPGDLQEDEEETGLLDGDFSEPEVSHDDTRREKNHSFLDDGSRCSCKRGSCLRSSIRSFMTVAFTVLFSPHKNVDLVCEYF